ncbi:cyclin-dependent kinase inhibitor 3-like isoform X2 [Miscanthus floridulus]|uniref:cyclin-dependent kinase inhibitor 3-like isoform X2 n=1 Tax=Miscanthus floridulus TaxID=154761 RepID=UPI0034590F88
MGKCVRIRGSSTPPPAAAASCLTLRSGRRVLAASSACSPRTSGRPRRHRGSALRRWCGAEAATANKHGSPRRRGAADAGSPKELYDDGRPEEEVPLSRSADTGTATVARGGDGGRGDSFERPKTPPLMTDDCDAAAAKAKAKHENESRRKGIVAGQPPPTEAEIEAFFAAAELAERRRFAEAYNYDVALDLPLEGRFEWAPLRT